MKKEEITTNRWLITIDLDGTTIGKKSNDNINYEVPKINIDAIKKLKDLGHHIAIVTGRPWRSTKEIYELLQIDTIVVNHNGSLIHRPKDDGFVDVKTAINRIMINEILRDEFISSVSETAMIDFADKTWVTNKTDTNFLSQFHVKASNLGEIHEFNPKETLLTKDPFSVSIKINKKLVEPSDVLIYLRRKYGNALAFRYWYNDELDLIFLEINPLGASKGSALKIIANYYNLPISNTIAFGDGLNDFQMIQEANFGIAMKNGHEIIKEIAKDITDKTNEDGGVGHYLNKFFYLKL